MKTGNVKPREDTGDKHRILLVDDHPVVCDRPDAAYQQ